MLGPRVGVMKKVLIEVIIDWIQRMEKENLENGEMWNVKILASLVT